MMSEISDTLVHLLVFLVRCACLALADDTATCDWLSPHSSPKSTPTGLEGKTKLLLTDLSGRNTHGQGGVKTDRRNTDTANLAACQIVSAVTTLLARYASHHHHH
ncbi:hypothetical protein BLNAU_7532 [Blattamonas nauphoetae]|uniref:Secreted protein n=1 Tax=Blattamonas nauphoetae TaxID=2049346 RepID=A0ABQ9Y1K6_9EUKA|nr:hypothetical protein BLNAU_7532 [Blattamonas nauphoetae]